MDKSFINIDDLVRQRLSGGEENERTGAWLQMRDLLDKEMPQKRVGFIYWRRIFSALTILILLGALSIGGYMYATSVRANNNDVAELAANISATPVSAASINNNEVNDPKQISSAVITHNNQNTNKQILASSNSAAHSSKEQNNKKRENAKNQQFLANLVAASERQKQLAIENDLKDAVGKKTTAANNFANDNKSAASDHQAVNAAIANNNNNDDNVTSPPAITRHSGNSKNTTKINTTKTNEGHSGKSIASASKTEYSNVKNKAKNAAGTLTGVLALNTKDKQTAHNIGKTNKKNGTVDTKKMALGSNALAKKNTTSSATKTPDAAIKPNRDNKPGVNNNNTTPGNNDKRIAGNNGNTSGSGASSKNTNPDQANNGIITKEVAATKMGKKVIDRLVLSEHYVKTAPNDGYYKLDTISMETVGDELGLNNEHDPNSAKRTASSNSVENNDATNPANSPILPGATTSATGQSGMGLKTNQVAKAGTGTSTIEKLTATFNDIKFHVAGAQFAPGLTGGINGTFFGPNSFKGFQFGVTGNFIFSENLSVMTELKYFHRINNNYALNDDYYTYTPVAGGQYSKELQPVSYSFSTLHSIELPISIRYCMSHFNFFVGGNIVYAFAINTGASTTPVTTNTPILVSAPGNDNTPKIKPDDFNSRFGLGYLLGISYQVSPNVTLDFRNVQTVWNNTSSQGAKIISNQLYKSPSLQVSVGYRLGGNKQKNKN